MTHSLTFGALQLTDSYADPEHGFVFSVLAEGVGFGVAKGVQQVITSLLADGDVVRIDRYGNREVSFVVEITGPSLGALAHGEVALRREVGRANALTWQAPDVLAVPTVFQVLASEMSQTFDDLDELRKRRKFTLTLTCAPFARSASAVTVAPLDPPPLSPSTVTIDDGTSTSGWTAYRGVKVGSTYSSEPLTPTTSGGAVIATSSSAYGLSLTRAFSSTSFSATRYLVVEFAKAGADYPATLQAYSGSTSFYPTLVALRATVGDRMRGTWDIGDRSITAFALSITSNLDNGPRPMTLAVYDVSRTDTMPQISNRQITRIVETSGTERTPASLHVSSADGVAPLQLAIVHTCPEDGSGYSPPLSRWITGGQDPTPDATTLISGSYRSVTGTGVTYEIPTAALPEGGYVLAARMARSATGTSVVSWSTSTIFPDSSAQQGFTGGNESIVWPDGDWHIIPIATLTLPSVRTKSGKVQVIIQAPVTGGPITSIDEAWLFRMGDDCALSIVETGYAHLWLNSAGVDGPVPTMWVGNGYSTKVHPGDGLQAAGTHVISAEGTAVFTAALADTPKTDATFYDLWHSNAAS